MLAGNTAMTSVIDDGELPAQRLERMRSEFVVAQQRRRDKASHAAPRPDDTDSGPLLAGPADEGLAAAVAVPRP